MPSCIEFFALPINDIATDVVVYFRDKFDKEKVFIATSDGSGWVTIDTKEFPDGYFNPYAGTFQIYYHKLGDPKNRRGFFRDGTYLYPLLNISVVDTDFVNGYLNGTYYVDTNTFVCCCNIPASEAFCNSLVSDACVTNTNFLDNPTELVPGDYDNCPQWTVNYSLPNLVSVLPPNNVEYDIYISIVQLTNLSTPANYYFITGNALGLTGSVLPHTYRVTVPLEGGAFSFLVRSSCDNSTQEVTIFFPSVECCQPGINLTVTRSNVVGEGNSFRIDYTVSQSPLAGCDPVTITIDNPLSGMPSVLSASGFWIDSHCSTNDAITRNFSYSYVNSICDETGVFNYTMPPCQIISSGENYYVGIKTFDLSQLSYINNIFSNGTPLSDGTLIASVDLDNLTLIRNTPTALSPCCESLFFDVYIENLPVIEDAPINTSFSMPVGLIGFESFLLIYNHITRVLRIELDTVSPVTVVNNSAYDYTLRFHGGCFDKNTCALQSTDSVAIPSF